MGMSRTFHVLYDGGRHGRDEHVLLWVPSCDVASEDLERSVLGRLGLPKTTRLYLTREDRVSVPLTAALPDGMRLRAHVVGKEDSLQAPTTPDMIPNKSMSWFSEY